MGFKEQNKEVKMKRFCYAVIMMGFCVSALGLDFSPPVIVNQGISGSNMQPSVFTDDSGRIYVAWANWSDSSRVYFGKSEDGGITWTDPSIRVNNASGNHFVVYPSIVVNSEENIYVTWTHWSGIDEGRISCSVSSDGGNNWSEYWVDDGSQGAKKFSSLVIDQYDSLYAIWHDERHSYEWAHPYFAKSGNGMNWLPVPNVMVDASFDTVSYSYTQPRLAVDDNGLLYAIFHHDLNFTPYWEIFFTASMDGGLTWRDCVPITTDEEYKDFPDIASNHDGSLLCAAWSHTHLFFSKSTDNGLTWVEPIQISSNTATLTEVIPRIGLDANENIYIVWKQCPEKKLYYSLSEDSGNTWTTPVYVNDNFQLSWWPHSLYVMPSGLIYLAWDDGNNIYLSEADNTSPLVTIMSPNGGELFGVGETCDITWIAEDNVGVDSISILYTTDAGISWDTIATGEPNDSLYVWTIPDNPSASCLVKLLAYNPNLNIGEDQSDSFFSIGQVELEENISTSPVFLQVNPNPFSELISINFCSGNGAKDAELKIYDVSGRLVRSFPVTDLCYQNNSVVSVCWDGTDDSSNEVQSGVYFCRFNVGDYQITRKLLRL